MHLIRREDFERGYETALRKGMRILPDEERTFNFLVLPVFANSLGNRQNVIFVEAAPQR
jgi:hypothetical protein